MNPSDYSSSVIKFNGLNYRQWFFQIKCALRAKGVLDVALGQDIRPTEKGKELTAWDMKDANAMFILCTSMDVSQVTLIENCDSSYGIIKKLDSVYCQKSEMNKMMVIDKFHQYKMDYNDNIVTHIAKIESLAKDVREIGESVSDLAIMTKILGTLPTEYRIMRQAWLSMPEEKQTLENLTSRLLDEETALSSYEKGENQALLTNSKDNIYQGKLFCNYCKRNNHDIKSCRILKAKNENLCFKCHKPGHVIKECNRELNEALVSIAMPVMNENNSFYLDSGATRHMCNNLSLFAKYNNLSEPIKVRLGDGKIISGISIGSIYVKALIGEKLIPKTIEDVLYVPELTVNLLSLSSLINKGFSIESKNETVYVKNCNNEISAIAKKHNDLFKMLFEFDKVDLVYHSYVDINEWHNRLAHQNFNHIKTFLKNNNLKFRGVEEHCESCIKGKMHRATYKNSLNKSKHVLEVVSIDLCGPVSESMGGSKYYLLFKDNYSHYKVVYFLKFKSEVKNKILEFIDRAERETGLSVKCFRSDNGTEILNNDIKNILKGKGIKHELSCVYSSEQNGAVEREIRTVTETARTLLASSNLPSNFWAEAVNCSVYILNLTGTSGEVGVSPINLWNNKSSYFDFSRLKTFGSPVYVHIPKHQRQKFDVKAKAGIFVGYPDGIKGFKVYLEDEKRFIVSNDVVFLKNNKPLISDSKDNSTNCNGFLNVKMGENLGIDGSEQLEVDDTMSNEEVEEPETGMQDRVLRNRETLHRPARYEDYVCFTYNDEPDTVDEVKLSPDKDKWLMAMREEMKSLNENCTWSLITPPQNVNIISNKWVFKKKYDTGGNVERFKARLVVRGCSQKYGIDYKETFSPVACMGSIRTILALAASLQLHIAHFDIKTAFLNGILEEKIYMAQPLGFEDGTNRVCLLNKSLYGLKQAPRCWNNTFKTFLKEFNLVPQNDDCVFVSNGENSIILSLYVDDGLLVGKNLEEMNYLLNKIKDKFGVSSIKFDSFNYLGISITRDEGGIYAHQSVYAKKLLSHFNMLDANPVSTPLDINQSFSDDKQSNAPFREAIGSLMYLATNTRPDIAYAVNLLSRYLDSHKDSHWVAVKRVMRYLKGTMDMGLKWPKSDQLKVEVFSDADFAGDPVSRKSTSGSVIKINGTAVQWKSQKQKIVALSTTEAELIAATDAVKEFLFIKNLLEGLMNFKLQNVALFVDNQSTLSIIKNGSSTSRRTKHIHVKEMFLREKFEEKLITPEYVPSHLQVADIFTKSHPKSSFKNLRDLLGVTN